MRMYSLLVLRRIFSDTIKPGVRIVSYSEYLSSLDCDGSGREISYMWLRILLQNQRVRWRIDIVGVPISREDPFYIEALQATREVGKNWYRDRSFRRDDNLDG